MQQNCIDEKLTGKCVEYHNDQWFEFTPEKNGNYYLNISGQNCRDVRGVQLVVFTGQPCKPETYHILSCTSLGSLDDVFVPLLQAKANQTYFLNVDGYLHDFGTFKQEISQSAKGMPAATLPLAPPLQASALVNLQWQLPDTVSATTFLVWRRRADQAQSELLKEVRVVRNAYGQTEENYEITDTLKTAGNYFYQVAAGGTPDNVPVLVQQLAYRWRPAYTRKYITLPLQHYRKKAELTIIAAHPVSGKVYRRAQMIVQKEHPMQTYFLLQHLEPEVGEKVQLTIIENRRSGPVSRSFLLAVEGSGE